MVTIWTWAGDSWVPYLWKVRQNRLGWQKLVTAKTDGQVHLVRNVLSLFAVISGPSRLWSCSPDSNRTGTQHPIPKSGKWIRQLCWPVRADFYWRLWVRSWGHTSLLRGSSLLWSASLLWCGRVLSWQQGSPGDGVTCGWGFLNSILDNYCCCPVTWLWWRWCGICFMHSWSTCKFSRKGTVF